jgi:hypothetical protein
MYGINPTHIIFDELEGSVTDVKIDLGAAIQKMQMMAAMQELLKPKRKKREQVTRRETVAKQRSRNKKQRAEKRLRARLKREKPITMQVG